MSVYKKPSKAYYIKQLIYYVLSPHLIFYILHRLAYIFVNQGLSRRKITIGKSSNIHPTVTLRHAERITVGSNCLINHNSVLQAGKSKAEIIIGDYVHSGPGVMIFAYNHCFEAGTPSILQGYTEEDITIGSDVWIGAGSILLAGSIVEDGVVIGAGSLVRGTLEKNTIYAGNPLKKIGKRR